MSLFSVLMTICAISIFDKKGLAEAGSGINVSEQKFRIQSCSVLRGEVYKLLCNGRGGILCILYVIIMIMCYKPVWEEYFITTDAAYEAYVDYLQGKYTIGKEQYLQKENKRFQKIENDHEAGRISESYECIVKDQLLWRETHFICERVCWNRDCHGFICRNISASLHQHFSKIWNWGITCSSCQSGTFIMASRKCKHNELFYVYSFLWHLHMSV